jgi:hypothetical protein
LSRIPALLAIPPDQKHAQRRQISVKTRSIFIIALTIALYAGTAAAYVGPGAGIGVVGALWGLIVGVVMAVGVILFWPIRMMIRKAKAGKKAGKEVQAETTNPGAGEITQNPDADPADAKKPQSS